MKGRSIIRIQRCNVELNKKQSQTSWEARIRNWKLGRNEGPEPRVRKPLRSKVAALSVSFLKPHIGPHGPRDWLSSDHVSVGSASQQSQSLCLLYSSNTGSDGHPCPVSTPPTPPGTSKTDTDIVQVESGHPKRELTVMKSTAVPQIPLKIFL